MRCEPDSPQSRTITLAPGAQAVINGALVTALGPCQFETGSGAFVLTGRSMWRDTGKRSGSAATLYFAMLEASAQPGEFERARFRLFAALSEVVAQDRTHEAQQECAACAAALVAGDAEAALASARRLAEASEVTAAQKLAKRGKPAEKRKGLGTTRQSVG